MKSILGFGYDRGKTVAEMFILFKEFDLLQIYYLFGNIDFNDEIKNRLFITKEREIAKPGNLRLPALHTELKINCYGVIRLCLVDFNEKNKGEAYKKFRSSYIKIFKKQKKSFVDRQWGDKKTYRKGVMSWINNHYGINR